MTGWTKSPRRSSDTAEETATIKLIPYLVPNDAGVDNERIQRRVYASPSAAPANPCAMRASVSICSGLKAQNNDESRSFTRSHICESGDNQNMCPKKTGKAVRRQWRFGMQPTIQIELAGEACKSVAMVGGGAL
ncbi:hypothetical protein KCP69_17435 [Salmonella enterica subsp. enterica]|nr:hypothetical protein KCP69_17435 [Salmonella enterica subsp. enterica]